MHHESEVQNTELQVLSELSDQGIKSGSGNDSVVQTLRLEKIASSLKRNSRNTEVKKEQNNDASFLTLQKKEQNNDTSLLTLQKKEQNNDTSLLTLQISRQLAGRVLVCASVNSVAVHAVEVSIKVNCE